MLTPGLPDLALCWEGPLLSLFLANRGLVLKTLCSWAEGRLAAGDWWCMCMLGVQLGGAKFDQTFLLPLKVLLGSWVQWWMAQSRAHAIIACRCATFL